MNLCPILLIIIFIINWTYCRWFLVLVWGHLKVAPFYIFVQFYFSCPLGSWMLCCFDVKIEFRSCARGCHWFGSVHYHWWTASIKTRGSYCPNASYASWGLGNRFYSDIHLRKLPTPPCSSLNSGVIRRSRVMNIQ